MYANSQPDDSIARTLFDLDDASLWKKLTPDSISAIRPYLNIGHHQIRKAKVGERGREKRGRKKRVERAKNIDLVRQPIPPLEPPSLEAHVAEQDLELVLKTLVSEHRKGLGVSPPLSPFSLLSLSPLFFHFRFSLRLPLIFFFF